MLTAMAPVRYLPIASAQSAQEWFGEVRARLEQLSLVPYLGPAVLEVGSCPTSYDELAQFFSKRIALPRRARGNPWASAQYVESQRLRGTVTKFMAEAFAVSPEPSPLQRYLAQLRLPLVVDTWYDASMRSALADRSDWAEVQGISRAGIAEERWHRAYASDGSELSLQDLGRETTVVYKPHGGVAPARNFLISDADYVEVLTEIDIQSPIPEIVKQRRELAGFLYLGCRFHDQLLRNYARQLAKRSGGPRFALVDPTLGMTRNEEKLFAELGVRVLVFPWAEGFARLATG